MKAWRGHGKKVRFDSVRPEEAISKYGASVVRTFRIKGAIERS